LAEEKSQRQQMMMFVRAVLWIEPDRRAPPESRVDLANIERVQAFVERSRETFDYIRKRE
jgi:hypothetical protein